jgi:hypothetical protein
MGFSVMRHDTRLPIIYMNPIRFIAGLFTRHIFLDVAKYKEQASHISSSLTSQFKRDKESAYEMRREVESVNGLVHGIQRTIKGTNEMIGALEVKLLTLNQNIDNVQARIADTIQLIDSNEIQCTLDKSIEAITLYVGDQSKLLVAELDVFEERAQAIKAAADAVRKEWNSDKKLHRGIKEMEDLYKRLGIVIAAVDYRGKILSAVINLMQITPDKLCDVYHNLRIIDTHYKINDGKSVPEPDSIPY